MNNPCYQAQQPPDKAIYDQPDFFNPHVDNDYAEINMNNNSTNQSISCHVASSVTADVSAKQLHEEETPEEKH